MKPGIHVIDDDESLRTALLRLLNGSGFEATGYGSTGDFLLRHPPDRHVCVLLDIRLPGGPAGRRAVRAWVRAGAGMSSSTVVCPGGVC